MGQSKEAVAKRNRSNRAKGRRFELACRLKFAQAGYLAKRIDETHIGQGRDLALFEVPEPTDDPRQQGRGPIPLNIAIQCKATQRRASGRLGLEEAIQKNPHAQMWACIHSFREKGKRPDIRIHYLVNLGHPRVVHITDWDTFLEVLEQKRNNLRIAACRPSCSSRI